MEFVFQIRVPETSVQEHMGSSRHIYLHKGPSVSTTTSGSYLKSEIESEKKKGKTSLFILEDLQNIIYIFIFYFFN